MRKITRVVTTFQTEYLFARNYFCASKKSLKMALQECAEYYRKLGYKVEPAQVGESDLYHNGKGVFRSVDIAYHCSSEYCLPFYIGYVVFDLK